MDWLEARVHHAARRRGRLAARGAGAAAAGDAGDWISRPQIAPHIVGPTARMLSKSVYLLSSPQRTRDASYLAPPAQIRTRSFPAYGSYLGCVTAKRLSGHG